MTMPPRPIAWANAPGCRQRGSEGEDPTASFRLLVAGYCLGGTVGFVTGVAISWSRLAGYWLRRCLSAALAIVLSCTVSRYQCWTISASASPSANRAGAVNPLCCDWSRGADFRARAAFSSRVERSTDRSVAGGRLSRPDPLFIRQIARARPDPMRLRCACDGCAGGRGLRGRGQRLSGPSAMRFQATAAPGLVRAKY